MEQTGEPATVDLSAVRLSFAPDVREELPKVVERQHGMFALLDKDDKTLARYLVRPSEWQPQEAIQDVSRDFRILMDPPEKWSVFRDLARRGIDLQHYQACALFDIGFRDCLQWAIAARATASPDGGRPAAAARLAIAAAQPCGIQVLEVSFAAP